MRRFALSPSIFLPISFLLFCSLGLLKSISDQIFTGQLIALGVGLLLFIAIQFIDVDVLAEKSTQIYVGSIVVLLLLALVGIASRGAVRWLSFFGLNAQISEIIKPFFALFIAHFIARRDKNLTNLLLLLVVAFPVIFLILRQPDLGSAMVYVLALLIGLIATGFPLRYFATGFGVLALVSPLLWHFLHDYQRQRLVSFLHLTSDPLGSSYNSIQSVIAVGAGQFGGRGIGLGSQSMLRFLPERHTDFIFAAFSEATGFLGTMLLLVAIVIYLRSFIVLALEANEPFDQLFFCFTFAFFFVQSIINIGMNMGLLPIVGITLPFVSYGGSSLVASFIFLGFVQNLVNSRKTKQMVEIR